MPDERESNFKKMDHKETRVKNANVMKATPAELTKKNQSKP